MAHKLEVAVDSFDQVRTFQVEIVGRRGVNRLTCQLLRDYRREGDGIYWAMQVPSVLKDHYTVADRAERDRLAQQMPVRNGDVVEIDGCEYIARVQGNYSDAVVFEAR